MTNKNFWQQQKVLVTGGAGFIGSHLVIDLVASGAQVRVVDNLSRGKKENLSSCLNKIEFVQGDLTDPDVANKACQGMDVVMHLASKVGGIGYYMKQPVEVYRNNLLMDTHVFLAAKDVGVKKFLFASSAHVYPLHLQASEDSAALKEEDAYPANPPISYGWAKLLTEKLIEYQNQEGLEMRTAVVRIVGAYGENQDIGIQTGSAIPVFCHKVVKHSESTPFTILGKGTETRSYCYVGDVVTGMKKCIEKLVELKQIPPINLGNEGRVTIGDIARLVIEASGKKIDLKQDLSAKDSGIRGQAVACDKTKALLDGWEPTVKLQDGIKRVYKDVESRLVRGVEK